MSKLATFVVAAAALVLAFVTLSPSSAEAGWRRWGYWGGPGVSVYVGPRWGWYAPRRYYYRPYAYYYPYAYYPYWRGRYWRGWY
ncbi:hypothetical protein [Methyloceanibacter sp.]|uniref:hypothetical protein n=1 Tax=Methyloceanibacter sp. TaxID=1965321 RepID=UPI002D29C09F|nr:hypothetical protein [Methyloceanibacter sp.]HZP09546.1 hypothetical protein [Methyloceanibacter sp.]